MDAVPDVIQMPIDIDKRLVKVWNVDLVNGNTIKAATIEQGPRQSSMCEGCPAPCCKGILMPVLTEREFLDRKFESRFTDVPDWLKEMVPNATHIVTLNVTDNGCPYHDSITGLCTVWSDCPDSCRAYDCRVDDRPEIKEFAKKREKEWLEQ